MVDAFLRAFGIGQAGQLPTPEAGFAPAGAALPVDLSAFVPALEPLLIGPSLDVGALFGLGGEPAPSGFGPLGIDVGASPAFTQPSTDAAALQGVTDSWRRQRGITSTPERTSLSSTPAAGTGAARWRPQIEQAIQATGSPLDADFVQAVMQSESGGDPNATSQAGAQGLMQLMPDTAAGLGVTNAYDPGQNIRGGVQFLTDLYRRYNGDLEKVAAAYNAGPGAVDSGAAMTYAETKAYVPKVLTTYTQIKQQRERAAAQGDLTPDQYNSGLAWDEAVSACGPAAAIAFARANGRNPTMAEAVALAKQVGWNKDQGMAGPRSQVQLLERMGVPARLEEGIDWNRVRAEVAAGRPVIVDTPGHYFVIERYDPTTGRFYLGKSGTALKASGGNPWVRPEEWGKFGSNYAPRSTIYMGY